MIEVAEMRCHVDVCFLMRRVGLLGAICPIVHLTVPQDEFSHLIRNRSQKLGSDFSRSIRLDQKSFRIRMHVRNMYGYTVCTYDTCTYIHTCDTRPIPMIIDEILLESRQNIRNDKSPNLSS